MIISFMYNVALSKFVDSSFPQCNVHRGVQGGCLAFTPSDGYRKLWGLRLLLIYLLLYFALKNSQIFKVGMLGMDMY